MNEDEIISKIDMNPKYSYLNDEIVNVVKKIYELPSNSVTRFCSLIDEKYNDREQLHITIEVAKICKDIIEIEDAGCSGLPQVFEFKRK